MEPLVWFSMLTFLRITWCGGCVQLDDKRSLRGEVLPMIEQSKFFKHTSLDDLITKVRCLHRAFRPIQ
jgi:hypothetical protein